LMGILSLVGEAMRVPEKELWIVGMGFV